MILTSIFCPHAVVMIGVTYTGNLSLFSGRMLPLFRHCCAFGSHHPHPLIWRNIFQTSRREQKQMRSWDAQCSANQDQASIEKCNAPKNLPIPDNSLLDARILYCTSPALGHNKVSNSGSCFIVEYIQLHECFATHFHELPVDSNFNISYDSFFHKAYLILKFIFEECLSTFF